jgi:hypothetical protein
MRTRKHRGGYSGEGYNNNATRNKFTWENNQTPVKNRIYKTTAENEAFAAQQNALWSRANVNTRSMTKNSSAANTYVPRAPRQVPILWSGINNEEVPAANRSLMNRVRGTRNNAARNATRKNNGRFSSVGKATRRLNIGHANNAANGNRK